MQRGVPPCKNECQHGFGSCSQSPASHTGGGDTQQVNDNEAGCTEKSCSSRCYTCCYTYMQSQVVTDSGTCSHRERTLHSREASHGNDSRGEDGNHGFQRGYGMQLHNTGLGLGHMFCTWTCHGWFYRQSKARTRASQQMTISGSSANQTVRNQTPTQYTAINDTTPGLGVVVGTFCAFLWQCQCHTHVHFWSAIWVEVMHVSVFLAHTGTTPR